MYRINCAKLLAASFIPLAMAANAAQAGFINGNLAVMQIGSGTAVSQSTTANPCYINEYSPTGTLVAQYPVPTAASGSNLPITLDPNTAQGRGQLTLSADGQSVVFSGWNAVPGTASVTLSPTINAGIGILNVATGTFDTSTSAANRTSDQIVIRSSGSNPPGYATNTRGVFGATMSGGTIWFSSTSSNPYEMGTQLITRGSVGLPTQVGAPNSAPAAKFITIYNGQLLVAQATGASSYNTSTGVTGNYYPQQQSIFGPAAVGSGLPTTPASWSVVNTTNGNTTTYSAPTTPSVLLTGFPTSAQVSGVNTPTASINSFAYADGGQTLYVVDGSMGLEKWALSGSTWAMVWSAGLPTTNAKCTGVTSTTDGINDYVYLTDTVISGSIGSSIYSVTDPIGSLTAPSSFNLLANSASGTFFGGIVAVPEPKSVGFAGLTLFAAMGRRRKA